MKNKKSLERSANARLNQAIRTVDQLKGKLVTLKEKGGPQSLMPEIRHDLSIITQCAHEFNAYDNALKTD